MHRCRVGHSKMHTGLCAAFGFFVDLSFDVEYICSLEIALLASIRPALFVRHCHALR